MAYLVWSAVVRLDGTRVAYRADGEGPLVVVADTADSLADALDNFGPAWADTVATVPWDAVKSVFVAVVRFACMSAPERCRLVSW